MAAGPLLFSTNPLIKLLIQERYRKDIHYVWCSESFDSSKQPGYSLASLVAPSSNPISIYRELRDGYRKGEKHSDKIRQTKTTLKALAVDWHSKGEISDQDKEEIILLADDPDMAYWRPLVYVIPRNIVEAKLKLVHLGKRASFGLEFVIEELQRNEFDIIEFE
ncbi:MAG: hypothetical protein E6R09_16975 [Rhodocyclaceae bacterium]|jgi:hypothetical protein|nr:MAG: hypothetical protein E6R09_16975 [Rhodocyclaceae bacterium]